MDNNNVNILTILSNQKGISIMAQSTSSYISKANKKIADETQKYLFKLFN